MQDKAKMKKELETLKSYLHKNIDVLTEKEIAKIMDKIDALWKSLNESA